MGLSDDDDHCQFFLFSHEIPFKFESKTSNVQQQRHRYVVIYRYITYIYKKYIHRGL